MSSDNRNRDGHNTTTNENNKPELSLVNNQHPVIESAKTESPAEPQDNAQQEVASIYQANEASRTHLGNYQPQSSNVISLFTGQSVETSAESARIVRIVPEISGIRMLYANVDQPQRLVAVPILCWALDDAGNITGLVPWLDEILPCGAVAEKYSVFWEGYYDPDTEEIFFEASEEVVGQLILSARYDRRMNRTIDIDSQSRMVVQEIADPVGTHALLLASNNDSLLLTSVVSWILDETGCLHGMLADDSAIEKLPVLPGDNCLFSAAEAENFRCYFQRDIAEQIRTQNPETLEAIEQLFAN